MVNLEPKNFNEYAYGAVRTLAPNPLKESTLHCIMGMAGEAGEFAETPYGSREKRIGEIGDCFWYAACFAMEHGMMFDDVVKTAMSAGHVFDGRSPEERALLFADRLIDRIKKVFFYGKPLNVGEFMPDYLGYVAGVMAMCGKMSVSPLMVCSANLKKLFERYPEKFDADRAINRDYLAESKAAGIDLTPSSDEDRKAIDWKYQITAVNPCSGNMHSQHDAILFLAKDKAVPAMIDAYRAECLRLGANPAHIEAIELLNERVLRYQRNIESKVPDTDLPCEIRRCVDGEGV